MEYSMGHYWKQKIINLHLNIVFVVVAAAVPVLEADEFRRNIGCFIHAFACPYVMFFNDWFFAVHRLVDPFIVWSTPNY